jgi:dephospho-CoA kinase
LIETSKNQHSKISGIQSLQVTGSRFSDALGRDGHNKFMNKTILAIVGLAGAGKTESTEYIMTKTNWPKIYFGQVVDGAKEQYGEINEANERKVREALRAEHGMAALAVANLEKIKELFANGNVIIESLYSWEEYQTVKKEFGENFKVLAIYTSFETRVKRMENRPLRPLTREQLESRDSSQIENLHQAGPIAKADWTINNEGSKEELYKNIDQILSNL